MPPASFYSDYFGDGVLLTICLGWPRTAILPISASQVGMITGISHQNLFWLHVPSRLRGKGWEGEGALFAQSKPLQGIPGRTASWSLNLEKAHRRQKWSPLPIGVRSMCVVVETQVDSNLSFFFFFWWGRVWTQGFRLSTVEPHLQSTLTSFILRFCFYSTLGQTEVVFRITFLSVL
jgi:hypothetical protein